MKFEVGFVGPMRKTQFGEANSQQEIFDELGYRLNEPIEYIKMLVETDGYLDWLTVYERADYKQVLAYVNAFDEEHNALASVPVSVVLESYQSIKKHPEIAREKERLRAIFPDTKLLVQKRFAR